MAEMRSAVVAGSKGFVDAVGGHIKMRLGAAPRVARDPAETLRACGDMAGLLVLEYAGTPWLDAVKSLRGARGDAVLSIVAAVPLAQASDVQPLQRAGVDEVVSWQGRVDPVLWAVDRVVGRSAQEHDPRSPDPAGSSQAPAEKGAEPPAVADTNPDAAAPSVPFPASAPCGVSVSAVTAPEVPWPDAVPSAPAAEAFLLAASVEQRARDGDQLKLAERVLAQASELERAAFLGADLPLDAGELRAAGAMRLRLEIALSTVPGAGGPVDQAAAQRLLADVDGVLERVKALKASAPRDLGAALDGIRLAVVDAGVKLAEAVSSVVPIEQQPAPPALAAKQPTTRVLTNEIEVPQRRTPPALWALLGLALACAVGYQAMRYFCPPSPSGPAYRPGTPAGSIAAAGPGQTLFVSAPTGAFTQSDVEKLRAAEEAKGNSVKQVAPGTLLVIPGGAPGEAAKGISP